MKNTLPLLFVLGLGLSACSATVTADGGCEDSDDDACSEEGAGGSGAGGSGAGGSTGTAGGTEGGGGTGGAPAGGLAVPWENLGGDVASAPAGTLLLVFGNPSSQCGAPMDFPSCEATPTWHVEIPLPVELQQVGSRIDLESLVEVGFGPFFSESVSEGDGLCSGGGGTLLGTLEVLEVTPSTLKVRLSETLTFDAEADGERILQICGPEV